MRAAAPSPTRKRWSGSRVTRPGATVVQDAGETRFVVDCKVNPVALVGHCKTTFVPELIMVNCGGGGGGGKVNANTVEFPYIEPFGLALYANPDVITRSQLYQATLDPTSHQITLTATMIRNPHMIKVNMNF